MFILNLNLSLHEQCPPAKSLCRLSEVDLLIKMGIVGKGLQILTNQKRENRAFLNLIGRNLRPFPVNTVLLEMGIVKVSLFTCDSD